MHCRLAVWAAAKVTAADSASRASSAPTPNTDTAKNTETTANVRLLNCMAQPSPGKKTMRLERFVIAALLLVRRHDIEPEVLVEIDEIAHEFAEPGLVARELNLSRLDRVLER
jgi:hypothetical protein